MRISDWSSDVCSSDLEAIAWLVLEHAGWRGPAKRFWTSSLTPTSLAKAVNALIDDREKKGMYIAARLRASMDWSDGVNWSRRSEERRVGKERVSKGRSRGSPYVHKTKKRRNKR